MDLEVFGNHSWRANRGPTGSNAIHEAREEQPARGDYEERPQHPEEKINVWIRKAGSKLDDIEDEQHADNLPICSKPFGVVPARCPIERHTR